MQRKATIVKISIFFLGTFIFFTLLLSIKRISFHWKGADSIKNENSILQNKENNCGPVALKMIFDHYKIPSTLNEIESNVKLNDKGTSMLALKETSELKGLHAEGWRLTVGDLLNATFPVILFVNKDHFIVVDSVIRDTLFVRDPTFGELKLHINKLSERWNGESLIFKK